MAHIGTGCPICHEPVGFLHTGYCSRRGVVKSTRGVCGYRIVLQWATRPGEPPTKHNRTRGYWGKLFPTAEAAWKWWHDWADHIKFPFAHLPGGSKLSMTVEAVWV